MKQEFMIENNLKSYEKFKFHYVQMKPSKLTLTLQKQKSLNSTMFRWNYVSGKYVNDEEFV